MHIFNAIILYVVMIAPAFSLDTEYSNVQGGVKFKILSLDGKIPYIRIENAGHETLAIKCNFAFGVTFKQNGEKVKRLPPKNGMEGNGAHAMANEQITIIVPGANLEIPMPKMYMNYNEDGYGESVSWAIGTSRMPKGKYEVFLTSNSNGLSVLNVSFSPFTINFDIPELEFEIK